MTIPFTFEQSVCKLMKQDCAPGSPLVKCETNILTLLSETTNAFVLPCPEGTAKYDVMVAAPVLACYHTATVQNA